MKTTPSAIKRAIMVAKAIGSKIDPGFASVDMPTDGVPLMRADGGETSTPDDIVTSIRDILSNVHGQAQYGSETGSNYNLNYPVNDRASVSLSGHGRGITPDQITAGANYHLGNANLNANHTFGGGTNYGVNVPLWGGNFGINANAPHGFIPNGVHASYTRHFADGGEAAPKFYSQGARQAAALPQESGSPEQMLGMLANRDVKPDEMQASGVEQAFGKAPKVSRQQLAEHFQSRMPEVGEEVTREGSGNTAWERFREMEPRIKLPGGENYREITMHAPNFEDKREKVHLELLRMKKAMKNVRAAHKMGSPISYEDAERRLKANEDGDYGSPPAYIHEMRDMGLSPSAEHGWDEKGQYYLHGSAPAYESGHFDRPNVLGHLRLMDRNLPNGERALHVDEAQSDWGQDARKHGTYDPGRPWSVFDTDTGKYVYDHATRSEAVNDTASKPHLDFEHTSKGERVPHHPLIAKTKNWADLLMKRALHEAAAGGYDKMLITPGQEQADRYGLEKHISALEYMPIPGREGLVQGKGHNGQVVLSKKATPDELEQLFGKDITQRLLATEPNDYIHRLEGTDLRSGGEGMKDFYDNILLKRLARLAKMHGSEAKIGSESLTVPASNEKGESQTRETRLHSLPITPEMRESILKNGFPAYKQGGEVEEDHKDDETQHISDWAWRPLHEVQHDLGDLKEIPSHVVNFGNFMDRIAERAGREGLSARDLIKAYTITRSSIQRRAADVDRVRKAGLHLPEEMEGKIRPEGAFGEWLHSPAGQAYLDAAQHGQVHHEAIKNAIQVMAPFGRHQTDIPDALTWAAENLPGSEKQVSELIHAGREKVSTPDEWRAFTKNIRGIGPSKSGFFASLMGRGDQPTLDARQIILHTGRPTSEAGKYIAKKGGAGGVEAVNRLAGRQEAMNLSLPEHLDPYYQHLAHHAVWDKAGNEETTHDDVMHAMQHAATGGEIKDPHAFMRSHHVGRIMHSIGMNGLGDDEVHEHFRDGGSPDMDRVREALQRTASPFSDDPEKVREALRISKRLKTPMSGQTGTGSFYGVKQPHDVADVDPTIVPIPGVEPLEKRHRSWDDLVKEGEGGTLINLGGDRSNLGRLTHINKKELAWPVDLHAGPKYMLEPNKGQVWANAAGHTTAIKKIIQEASKKGPVYGVYSPMGPRAVDSSHNMIDALLAQIPGSEISHKDAERFDEDLRAGKHAVPKIKAKAIELMANWPGILNAKAASEFARSLPGAHRSSIVKHMDKSTWRDAGFPAVGVTRAAISDPDVKGVSGNMFGHRVVRLSAEGSGHEPSFTHSTYTGPTHGEYFGDVPLAQRHYVMPDVIEKMLGKPAVGGQIVHPYSLDPMGRSTARKLFEEQKQQQPINQRMRESIQQGLERQKEYGLNKGGAAVDRAVTVAMKAKKRS